MIYNKMDVVTLISGERVALTQPYDDTEDSYIVTTNEWPIQKAELHSWENIVSIESIESILAKRRAEYVI